ncbi:hypothetical protein PU630_07625 [Microbacterium horticulturae]|uniref:Uncharacterized protein n=1 Tax=Microbacterium horticulturae TaxID=3028316 RepID=A0ABY8C1S5_9MICO|nr:hypothetical protein [Microbacterium sp. KACC 23027]WEG10406.1 hypothetical protein PU630_07625 [Microbacterium sp. KACC 23027]
MDQALSWGVFIATAATAAFTAWAVWQRWRYTPRPMWVGPSRSPGDSFTRGGEAFVTLGWRVENRGDAAAHDVRSYLAGPDGTFVEQRSIAVVDSGESIGIWFETRRFGSSTYDPTTGEFVGDEKYEWSPQRMRVCWRQHPNLKHEKSREWELPAPPPEKIK